MSRDSEYTAKHKAKRQAKPVGTAFVYLDDERQRKVYEKWQTIKNKKEFIMRCIESYQENDK